MKDNKNLIVAIALSMLVLLLWDNFFAPKPVVNVSDVQEGSALSFPKGDGFSVTSDVESDQVVEKYNKFVEFENDDVFGKISLQGLRFDNLSLKKYSKEAGSEERVKLLSDSGNGYFLEINYLSDDFVAPTKNSIWKLVKGSSLVAGSKMVFRYKSPDKKVKIYRTISLDDNYLFEIEDSLVNLTNLPINFAQYGIINKTIEKLEQQFLILHEGPLGVFDHKLEEISYKKLKKKKEFSYSSNAGWIGISDKYWLTNIVPSSNQSYKYRFSYYHKDGLDRYQADFKSENISIAPKASVNNKNLIFVGAKEIEIIDKYEESKNIELFDHSIDFGILYFITKPIFLLLKILHNYLSNFGVAIIALTIVIRLIVFPLASKSFKEITKMKSVQPEIIKLRASYKDDKMRLNREVMKLYQTHKINPMMGCFPVIIQVFIFFALYKVLFITIDMRHAPFFGWIHDLTAPDPTNLFNLFGLLPFNLETPFGVWPCFLCITMILQQKLNPAPADPMQAKMMKFLPYLFLFLFSGFPAGLVVYWTFNNGFSIIQQYFIQRKFAAKKK